MEYLTTEEIAEKWGVSRRRVQRLVQDGRIEGAVKKEHYKDYLRVAVIAYDDEAHFYENCGFEKSKDASPMFITSLWT